MSDNAFTLEPTPACAEGKDPDRNLWATPQDLVDAVSEFMGSDPWIDLCASEDNRKARCWIGEDGAGNYRGPLESWPPLVIARHVPRNGWAWCNPPYSADAILSIAQWLAEFAKDGGIAALLVNIDESTRWHRVILPYIRARLALTSRVQFIPPPGVAPSTNSRSQTIYILGPRRPWDGPSYPAFPMDYPREQNLNLFEDQ